MLIHHRQSHTTQPISHDPYSTLFDLTAIDTRLKPFNHNNKPAPLLRSSPIVSRQTVLQHNDYNCGIEITLNAIIYLFHLFPNTFPWHSLYQPTLLESLHPIVLATIITNSPPNITVPQHASIDTASYTGSVRVIPTPIDNYRRPRRHHSLDQALETPMTPPTVPPSPTQLTANTEPAQLTPPYTHPTNT